MKILSDAHEATFIKQQSRHCATPSNLMSKCKKKSSSEYWRQATLRRGVLMGNTWKGVAIVTKSSRFTFSPSTPQHFLTAHETNRLPQDVKR